MEPDVFATIPGAGKKYPDESCFQGERVGFDISPRSSMVVRKSRVGGLEAMLT